MRKSLAFGAGACAVAFAVTSCSSDGIYSMPLPGGPDVGEDPISIHIEFEDVLDLVPQTAVKVDGVSVGRVTSVEMGEDGWTASVGIVLDSSVALPSNALASVDQTNLLGEKFIQLTAPDDPAPSRLVDGGVIPLQNTKHSTEIEQVLGALSLLLNGGGVGQLQPIIHELSTAMDGREGRVKELLYQANDLIGGLNDQRDDITRALDGLDVLNSRVAEQNEKIALILDELPIAAEVLEQQRPELTQMLVQLDRVGQAGMDVINKSKDDLIADLLALRPTLQALAASGQDLPDALPFLPTVPFPDGVEQIALGGAVNLFLVVDLQLGQALEGLGVGQPDPVYVAPYGEPQPIIDPSNPWYNGNGPRPGWPTVSLLPILPRVPTLGAAPAPGAPPSNPVEGFLEQFGIGGGR